ncbi:MAG: ferrochelatase [Burkholderiales bacterium]
MPRYLPEPANSNAGPARSAVLLVNLGTPQAPTAAALRVYLRQFLSDPRVIEIPRLLWWPLLYGVILTFRPRRSAHKYAQIWSTEGSPLNLHTQRQAKLLQGFLGVRGHTDVMVDYAMRYGAPSVAQALDALRARNCQRVLVLPLYPQYAASSTGSAVDAVCAALQRMRNVPEMRFVKDYHDHPGYIEAVAQNVRSYWVKHGAPAKLLVSFHGLPRYTVERGDPYRTQCERTAGLLMQALRLDAQRCEFAFQSRFGPSEWLQPYLSETLKRWAQQRIERVDVVCPGFTADCLETLEEIALTEKADFLRHGGGEFHYIPALNENDAWIRALCDIAVVHLQGWPGAPRV